MKIHKTKHGKIFHAVGETQKELASAFLRFQEYYESPNDSFRGKKFSLDEYKTWYTKVFGEFTYYEDWDAFNVPGKVIIDASNGLLGSLSQEEFDFMSTLLIAGLDDDSYVIGTYDESPESDFKHEFAHAMYATNAAYKEAVSLVLGTVYLPKYNLIIDYFRNSNYHDEVFLDELNSYVAFDLDHLALNGVEITDELKELSFVLQKLFEINYEAIS